MAHAERRARRTGEVLRPGARPLVGAELEATSERSDPLAGIAPVAAVIAFVLAGLYFSGRANAPPGALLREIVAAADSFAVLIWASFGGGLVAILLALARRSMRIGEVADAYASGCKAMVMAVLVLTLAWAISRVCRELDLGPWIASLLNAKALKAVLPAAVFLAAALISFATGTSWGTMAILIPIAGSLAGQLGGTPGHVHVATLAAVLTGAIFGDHCSPISDTTVLSSIASGADHVDHVRTQLPYAVTIAAIAFAAFLAVGYGAPVGAVLGAGAVLVAATVVLVGQPAE
jgi:Na+/H+ antiporter NhaC